MGHSQFDDASRERAAWNAGKHVGIKRPLTQKQIWAIRFFLDLEKRIRDGALFDLAIDSKLRGCDLVKIRIRDVVAGPEIRTRAIVVQQKTGRPVQFEITSDVRASMLGSVDGFDEDEAQGEGDDGSEAAFGLLAAQGDALESLQFSEALLDAGTAPVKRLREEGRPVLRVGFERDSRRDAAGACDGPVGLGVIALVGEGRARRDVGAQIQQQLEDRAVAGLTTGQVEGDRLAVEIALEVDLGGEAAARAAEGLTLLPPFAPAAETWARTTVESNIWTRWAVRLREARVSKNSSNTPAWRSRQNLFQTLFHAPNSAGSARQEMLCTVK